MARAIDGGWKPIKTKTFAAAEKAVDVEEIVTRFAGRPEGFEPEAEDEELGDELLELDEDWETSEREGLL